MKLVVNADDFGYCKTTNDAIVEAFEDGIVTQSSIIVNSLSCDDAVRKARDCELPLGLHLNLTEGFPVCSTLSTTTSNLVTTLLQSSQEETREMFANHVFGHENGAIFNQHIQKHETISPQANNSGGGLRINNCCTHQMEEGGCESKGDIGPDAYCMYNDNNVAVTNNNIWSEENPSASRPFFLGKVAVLNGKCNQWDSVSLRKEIQEQANTFEKLVGYKCYHMDGHNHVNVLENVLKDMIDVLGDTLKSTRMPASSSVSFQPPPKDSFLGNILSLASTHGVEMCKSSNIFTADSFLGLYDTSLLSSQMILDDIQALVNNGTKSCEYMVHPGKIDESYDLSKSGCGMGFDRFAWHEDRWLELKLLKDPLLKQGLEELDVELVSFSDLP
eukprot:m.31278 g.31278  ORF g.31278 m.31278 type:complete len:388 (+) comp6299_c0_seq2:322-1485(+)